MIAYLFIILGLVFIFFGTLGIIRFPDIYTRLQTSSKCKVRCCRRRRVACRFDGEGGFRFVILKDINNIGVFIVNQSGSFTCNSTLCCHQRDKAMAEEKEMLKGVAD